jgi:hypothetical protein
LIWRTSEGKKRLIYVRVTDAELCDVLQERGIEMEVQLSELQHSNYLCK